MNPLAEWEAIFICPIDHAPLMYLEAEQRWACTACTFRTEIQTVSSRLIPDFRAVDTPQTVQLSFSIPTRPLERDRLVETCFLANQVRMAPPRQKIRTKLTNGHRYYCEKILNEYGPDCPILDLGCGSGDNRLYLYSIGFRRVLTVDWLAEGADMLVDAHRLPFADHQFQVVISTAVFEHLYNPFIAMTEIGRVLKAGGYFLGGASFWESWHGSSYFHLTPDGWNALLQHAGMQMEDLWPGWGVIPALIHHVLIPGHFRRLGYRLQAMLEWVYRLIMGESGVRRLQLRASGSYQVLARKIGM